SSCFPNVTLFNKLEPIFVGPYPISRCFPETDNYTIDTPLSASGHITVHTSVLAPWLENPDDKFPSRTHTMPGPILVDATAPRYELERVIKHNTHSTTGVTTFLIKWKGYGHEANTWQKQKDI